MRFLEKSEKNREIVTSILVKISNWKNQKKFVTSLHNHFWLKFQKIIMENEKYIQNSIIIEHQLNMNGE